MIRPLNKKDKEIFITLTKEFYNSDAVIKPLPENFYPEIFKKLLKKNSTAKAFIIEMNGIVCGYGVINVTFSMEAGGDTLGLKTFILEKIIKIKVLVKNILTLFLINTKKLKGLD